MLSGDFARVLRVLNPKLRVCSLGDNGKLAGIYYIDQAGVYQDVCAIDKNEVPEFPEYDAEGHLVKAGWRRAVFILLQQRLTSFRLVRRLWPGFFLRRAPCVVTRLGDPIARRLDAATLNPDHAQVSTEEILSMAQDIRKKDSPARQEEREHDRWFLSTWKKNGGNVTDKPNY